MTNLDKRFQHLKKLIGDTVAMLVKQGIKFDERYQIDGTVGITIDNKSVVLIKLDQLVETESARNRRTKTETPKRSAMFEVEEETDEDEEFYDEDEVMKPLRGRKRRSEEGRVPPGSAKKIKTDALKLSDSKKTKMLEETPEIVDEEDGCISIGDIFYTPTGINKWGMTYEGYHFSTNATSTFRTSWLCHKGTKGEERCTKRVSTVNNQRFGQRGPGRLVHTTGFHNHEPPSKPVRNYQLLTAHLKTSPGKLKHSLQDVQFTGDGWIQVPRDPSGQVQVAYSESEPGAQIVQSGDDIANMASEIKMSRTVVEGVLEGAVVQYHDDDQLESELTVESSQDQSDQAVVIQPTN